MSISSVLERFYAGNYKKYLILPAVLFILFLFFAFAFPGLKQGIDLKGGTLLIVQSSKKMTAEEIKPVLREKFSLDDLTVTSISSPTGYGLVIQFAKNHTIFEAEQKLQSAASFLNNNPSQTITLCDEALSIISSYYVPEENRPKEAKELLLFSSNAVAKAKEIFHRKLQTVIKEKFSLGEKVAFQIKEVAPTVGEIFWNNALFVAAIAIVLIVIVIFAFFRLLIPSLAIIAAALFDIVSALAGMALFSIPLSLSTMPALLMLIGYSVDTDVMLTTRLTQLRGSIASEKAFSSLKTGLTMTGTTLGAITVMLLLSYFAQMLIIFEIAAVIFFGLLGDLVSTWFMNAPVLLWFVERREGGR